ncbi:MFS transporter [Cryptosporangium japonicum]|uniref:MFS transporter n=1 Tax=Cryptosporangium japonicum TaxID=80872 RepID=A0ABN0UT82_9ACTN
MESKPQAVRGAGRREWVGLGVLALPTLLLALDFSVLYLVLPRLSADLHPTAVQVLWISDVYGLLIAGFLIPMGTLGDRLGRRRLLLAGAVLFAGASILAAYSTGPLMLIAARALMGVAAATLMPSTLALISNLFAEPAQRARAISVWVACFMGGAALGPILGGALLTTFWWGSVFLLGVPVMVLLLVTAPFVLPEQRSEETAGRIDAASVLLSLGAVLTTVYGIKELAGAGRSLPAVTALVVGAAAGSAFVHRQRRLAEPLLDLRLFRRRPFSAGVAAMTLNSAIMGGTALLINLHLQAEVGRSPAEAALLLAPGALAIVVSSLAAPLLVRRLAPTHVIAGGMAVAAVGYLVLARADAAAGPLVAANVLIGLGAGPITALVTDLIVGSVPAAAAGSAAAISETGGDLGIALGVATLGSLGTTTYSGATGLTAAALVAAAVAVAIGVLTIAARPDRPTT